MSSRYNQLRPGMLVTARFDSPLRKWPSRNVYIDPGVGGGEQCIIIETVTKDGTVQAVKILAPYGIGWVGPDLFIEVEEC